MQAHAAHAGAALALELREILGIDAIAETKRSLSGARAGGGAAGDGGGGEGGEKRLLGRERVGGIGIGLEAEAFALEQPAKLSGHLRCDARHLGIVGRGEWEEARRLPGPRLVDPVEHERVKVDIRIKRIAEALQNGDRAALTPVDAPLLAGTAAERSKDGAHEEREHGARPLRVVGQAVAQREGE